MKSKNYKNSENSKNSKLINNLKFFYCNIRSYKKNKIAVDILINHGKFDLIILTETWLDKALSLTS